jgi:DNA-binding CsgD family transcriptional regulator
MFQTPDPRRDDPTALDQPMVWQEITRVARAALREAAEADAATPSLRSRVRTTALDGETWAVRAQPLLQAAHGQPVVVVAIERVSPRTEADEVRDRFDLSPRQAEVALLLARRFSDKEIAARLGISRHTARRHVELVMLRLRVHSRAEVGAVLGQLPGSRLAAGAD